ncbi:MAG: hypothetical protein MJE68_26415 [Proteobacteria bacterium]|nr:hypothetical protein [Pseudomonadota bacterium]
MVYVKKKGLPMVLYQTCETCRFFYQRSSQKGTDDGECLRYPPQLVNDGINEPYWSFPETRTFNNCGEWKPILESGNTSVYDEE